MTSRVVLDTNVLVSSLLSNGPPSVIVDLVAEGKIIPFYSDHILGEYWDVLQRSKFDFNPSQISRLIGDIMRAGMATETNASTTMPLLDEDDRKFFDAAKASNAFLITGNMRHFPSEPFIVTPSDFLREYRLHVNAD